MPDTSNAGDIPFFQALLKDLVQPVTHYRNPGDYRRNEDIRRDREFFYGLVSFDRGWNARNGICRKILFATRANGVSFSIDKGTSVTFDEFH